MRCSRDLQFFGSAMVELHYNRRAFTASLASLLLSPISVGHGQQLARSSLKLGVANKAHLYYLPVTIAERRGHFRDYGPVSYTHLTLPTTERV